MAVENANAILLAELIENPDQKNNWHTHREKENSKGPKQIRPHELSNGNDKATELQKLGIVRGKYPNFEKAGFSVQAFVDIKLGSSTDFEIPIDVIADMKKLDSTISVDPQTYVRYRLLQIPNIIHVYTVFGDVDVRCKVVAENLRVIESTAMKIRQIPFVRESSTAVIVDETPYPHIREQWATLVRENAELVETAITLAIKRRRNALNGNA